MAITQPGVIQYTVYVEKNCHCVCDIMIVVDDKIEVKSATFSKCMAAI